MKHQQLLYNYYPIKATDYISLSNEYMKLRIWWYYLYNNYKLSFSTNIKNTSYRATNRALGLLVKQTQPFSNNLLIILNISIIRWKLDFCSITWLW